MKSIVVLENQFWQNETTIGRALRDFTEKNKYSVDIIEHAEDKDPKELLEKIAKCDIIFFTTTWLYESSVHSLGKLLSHPMVASKDIYYQGDKNVAYHLEKIFNEEELAKLAIHRFFIINHSITTESDWVTGFNMLCYKTAFEESERIRIEKNQGFKKTGRKIKILNLSGIGSQFEVLKPGSIVDELDCKEIDPNPSRGVWVMGKDEPVKVLNSDGHMEWQYDTLSSYCLSKEFHSMGNKSNSVDSIEILAEWIKKCTSKLKLSERDLWDHCDNICNVVGVERRKNRSYFESRLNEYRNKYVYFQGP